MTEVELRKLDYEKTLEFVGNLLETRFKLLGLLPLATGGALALAEYGNDPQTAAALAILGFVATLGIMFYDQRNTEIYEREVRRAKLLELQLGLPPASSVEISGGPLMNRPGRGRRFLGLTMWHDRGLILIYSVCLALWAYVLTQSISVQVEAMSRLSLLVGLASGAAVFVAVFAQLHALDRVVPTELETMEKELQALAKARGGA